MRFNASRFSNTQNQNETESKTCKYGMNKQPNKIAHMLGDRAFLIELTKIKSQP